MKRALFPTAIVAVLIVASLAHGQVIKTTPTSLFGWQEQRQILQLQKQLADQNAAQIAFLQQQILLLQQNQQRQFGPTPAPAPALPPIHIYLPGGPAPKLDPNPGVPKLDPNPGVPKLDPNPGTPKLDPNPGTPKLDPNPGVPKLDLTPGKPPNLNPPGPPVGYQRYTTERLPVISATVTDQYGNTRPATVWTPGIRDK